MFRDLSKIIGACLGRAVSASVIECPGPVKFPLVSLCLKREKGGLQKSIRIEKRSLQYLVTSYTVGHQAVSGASVALNNSSEE